MDITILALLLCKLGFLGLQLDPNCNLYVSFGKEVFIGKQGKKRDKNRRMVAVYVRHNFIKNDEIGISKGRPKHGLRSAVSELRQHTCSWSQGNYI